MINTGNVVSVTQDTYNLCSSLNLTRAETFYCRMIALKRILHPLIAKQLNCFTSTTSDRLIHILTLLERAVSLQASSPLNPWPLVTPMMSNISSCENTLLIECGFSSCSLAQSILSEMLPPFTWISMICAFFWRWFISFICSTYKR